MIKVQRRRKLDFAWRSVDGSAPPSCRLEFVRRMKARPLADRDHFCTFLSVSLKSPLRKRSQALARCVGENLDVQNDLGPGFVEPNRRYAARFWLVRLAAVVSPDGRRCYRLGTTIKRAFSAGLEWIGPKL